MDRNQIHTQLLALLTGVAPDIDPDSVDPVRNLRDQFDFDSMDALHFAVAVSETFGIEIAETDAAALANLKSAEQFVEQRLMSRQHA